MCRRSGRLRASARWQQSIFGYSRQAIRALTAALLAAALAGGTGAPAFAQDPGQSPPPTQQEQRPELPTPQSPEQNRPNQDPNAPTQQPAAGLWTWPHESSDSSVAGCRNTTINTRRKPFPNLFAPYRGMDIPEFNIINKPRVEQLIHDGKLEITLQDAVELALENNMDIAVARYQPWLADTDILATKGGGQGQGTNGVEIPSFDGERPAVGSGSSADRHRRILPTFRPRSTTRLFPVRARHPIN